MQHPKNNNSASPMQDSKSELTESISGFLEKIDIFSVESLIMDFANDVLGVMGGVMIVVDNTDNKGKIIYANRTFTEMVGLPYRQIRGRAFYDFLHPDDKARTGAEYAGREGPSRKNQTFVNRYMDGPDDWQYIAWPPTGNGGRERMVAVGYKVSGPDDPFIKRWAGNTFS